MPLTLTISRDGAAPVEHQPAEFELTCASFGAPAELIGQARLRPAEGWSVETGDAPLTWRVRPHRVNLNQPALFALEVDGRRWTADIAVALDLRSTFDPQLHAL